jgi:hypothetical protein|tara:strand:+ start:150 stop:470 length:321 start_codon:yes stop_codon:yes gene_type:complete
MTTLHDIIDNFDEVSKLNDVYLAQGINPSSDRPDVPYIHEPKIIGLYDYDDDWFEVEVQVNKNGIDKYAYEALGDGYLGGHLLSKDREMSDYETEIILKPKNKGGK